MRQAESIPSVELLENRQLLSGSLVLSFAGRLPKSLPVAGTGHISLRLSDTSSLPVNGPVVVQLFASPETTLDGSAVALASSQINLHLRPGRGTNARIDFPSPVTLPNGDYFLLARVQGSAVVVASPKPVGIAMPFSDVSLSFVHLPVELIDGSAACSTATLAITNVGNIPARGKANISLYLSTDAMLDAGDPLLATSNNRSIVLSPHRSAPVNFRVVVPAGTAVGGYFLIATITPLTMLVDSNSANNTAVSSSRLAVVTQSPQVSQHRNNFNGDENANAASCPDVIAYVVTVPADDCGDTTSTPNPSDDSTQDDSNADGNSPDSSSPAPADSAPAPPDASSDDSSASDTWDSNDVVAAGGDF